MVRAKQSSLLDILAQDDRPIDEWAADLVPLAREIYPHDDRLASDFEKAVRGVGAMAADLPCIGADDPSAPSVEAPTREILGYLFRRWPEERAELNRLVTRAAQVLGRQKPLRR